MGSEILGSQMCYMCSEIWSRKDYLGSDISGMSVSDHMGSLKKLV